MCVCVWCVCGVCVGAVAYMCADVCVCVLDVSALSCVTLRFRVTGGAMTSM